MRALKTLVVVMGVLLVVGFAALVAIVAGRLTRPGGGIAATASAPFAAAPIELPRGARIETMAAGPDRLVLDLVLADGERQLVVIDLASGRRLGTVPLHSAP